MKSSKLQLETFSQNIILLPPPPSKILPMYSPYSYYALNFKQVQSSERIRLMNPEKFQDSQLKGINTTPGFLLLEKKHKLYWIT